MFNHFAISIMNRQLEAQKWDTNLRSFREKLHVIVKGITCIYQIYLTQFTDAP